MQSPYEYTARKGVRPISWNDFHGLTRALAVAVAPWQPQIILPIGRTLELRVEAVRAAVLFAHSPAVAVPDYIGLITDKLLINPWDREIFQDGAFHYHPENIEAISSQVPNPESFLPIDATPFIVDKAMGI